MKFITISRSSLSLNVSFFSFALTRNRDKRSGPRGSSLDTCRRRPWMTSDANEFIKLTPWRSFLSPSVNWSIWHILHKGLKNRFSLCSCTVSKAVAKAGGSSETTDLISTPKATNVKMSMVKRKNTSCMSTGVSMPALIRSWIQPIMRSAWSWATLVLSRMRFLENIWLAIFRWVTQGLPSVEKMPSPRNSFKPARTPAPFT
mmetsp:Transcript_4776/g.14181  ORF Transcript_4776/g.14181 Transcript_4776/m.14181 type:complete len:202 (-) Transcript_4776:341-946(-)